MVTKIKDLRGVYYHLENLEETFDRNNNNFDKLLGKYLSRKAQS